jgi:NADH-quinone oxidoreductase subunit C
MADEPTSKQPEKRPETSEGQPPARETSAQKPAEKPAGEKPVPPKKEAPPAWPKPLDNEMVRRFRQRFGDAILDALEDRKQAILVVAAERLREIAEYARDEEQFDMLTDLTAVDWPKREKRFDLVVNLYSFPRNERLRLKAAVGEHDQPPSLAPVWAAANWLERECFDMFGIRFEGHPDLRRILLPDEWVGHPLRKDYDILQQDTAWVRENLGIESGQ